MTDRTDDLAARLLDAHVAFACRQLTDPDEFDALVREEIAHGLDDAANLTLAEAVTPEMIKAVAHKYAVAFPVEGAIPELVGRVAARLYAAATSDDERSLVEILGRRQVDELVDDVAHLGATRRILDRVLDSPATVDTVVEAVARSVDSSRLPNRLRLLVDGVVESATRHGAAFVLRANRTEPEELFGDALRDLVRAGADQRFGTAAGVVEAGDLEDGAVLVFEFWRVFRDTDFFASLLADGIDEVFATYGDTPLADLLDDLGIRSDDLVEEAFRFGPPVISELDRRGLLEAAIRRRLAPFYASTAFTAALD